VVESVIVLDRRAPWYNKQGGDVEQANRQAMEQFVHGTGCRRVVLGKFMDGCELDCKQVGGELCDWCQEAAGEGDRQRDEIGKGKGKDASDSEGEGEGEGDSEGEGEGNSNSEVEGNSDSEGKGEGNSEGEGKGSQEAGATLDRLMEHCKEEQRRIGQLHRWLRQVEGKCGVCFVKWNQDGRLEERQGGYRHRAEQCSVIARSEYMGWRRRVRFASNGCCLRCGLPKGWCVDAGHSETKDCVYLDQVKPVMMLAGRNSRLGELVRRELEVEAGKEEEYIGWVGRTRRMYGEDMTNGLAVWDVIVRGVCS
jgi:hypothetical protein